MHVYLTIRIIGTFYISSLRIKTTEILCCATVLYFKQQHSRVAAQPCLDYTGIMCICTFTILEGTIVFEHGSLVSACMAIQLLYTFLPIRLYVCIAVHTYIHTYMHIQMNIYGPWDLHIQWCTSKYCTPSARMIRATRTIFLIGWLHSEWFESIRHYYSINVRDYRVQRCCISHPHCFSIKCILYQLTFYLFTVYEYIIKI